MRESVRGPIPAVREMIMERGGGKMESGKLPRFAESAEKLFQPEKLKRGGFSCVNEAERDEGCNWTRSLNLAKS
jgi:hypothetical protein